MIVHAEDSSATCEGKGGGEEGELEEGEGEEGGDGKRG